MGPCPQGVRVIFCLVSTSFYSGLNPVGWFDKTHKLPSLNAESNTWTLSGASGGGLTATNFHVAHSAKIKGAGLFISSVYSDYDWSEDSKTTNKF